LKYWLNIDFPSRYVMLHKESCIFCRPHEQKNKGVNEIRLNGGWYEFKSMEAAETYYEMHYTSFRWNKCKRCSPK
jgi:hypothetical protein